MGKRYFYTLDLVRFIAASLVAIFHLTWLSDNTEAFLHWGWIGVQIFFVLSGFVILESARYGNANAFIRSRILRLYPAAVICSVISFLILLQYQGFSLELLVTFIKSFFLYIQGPYLATAYWTLPIEIAFYALIYIVIKYWSINYINKAIVILTLFSSLYIFLYSLHLFEYIYAPFLEFGYGVANMTLLRHGIYFSMGVILYLHFHKESDSLLGKVFLLALASSFLEIASRAVEVNDKVKSISFIESFLIPVVIFGLFIILIFFVIIKEEIIPSRYQRFVRAIGLSSYPIYLIHEVLGNRIKNLAIKYLDLSDLIAVALSYFLVVLCSLVIAQKIEPQIRMIFKKIMTLDSIKKAHT